ncbi:MAG: TolC family protein [Ferruginibacter sp.]
MNFNMLIRRLSLMGLLIVLFATIATAQTPATTDTLVLSLREAIQLAIKQNPQLQSVQLDEEINRYKIKEVKSSALPQVKANANYNDNYSIASQLLPAQFFGGAPGTYQKVQFGTRYNMNATVQLTQKIYDAGYKTGVKAAKESQGYYELNTFKSREELIYQVVNLYVQAQMTEKQIELVQGNMERMKILLDITTSQFREGIIKKVDVDQLKVNSTNLTTQLSNSQNSYAQLMNNLKTILGISVYVPLKMLNNLGSEPTLPVSDTLLLNQNTELNLLNYQIKLQQLNTDNIRAGYQPSLSAFLNYGRQAQTNALFKGSQYSKFGSGVWGLQLTVPIFDGFERRNKIKQSTLTVKQMELNKKYLVSNINSDFVNAGNNLSHNQQVLNAQQENMQLAEELYTVAKLSYTEGISPLPELVNAENALREAQTQYLTALFQMNIAQLEKMKTSGQLSKIIRESNQVQ